MKVKELSRKMGNFGTNPYIYIQRDGSIIGGGKPDEVSEKFGGLTVNFFISAGCGEIKIYVR